MPRDGNGDVAVMTAVQTEEFATDHLCDEIDEDDFCDMLLAALVAMAAKSKRRQADLGAVMRRGRLAASPERISRAMQKLEALAFIREIVPLYDGGTLVTVTNMGMDLLGRSADWRFLQELRNPY